jgi:hypothetical protein
LSADDGIHAVAYDAIHVNVVSDLIASIARAGPGANVTWNGSAASYVVERATNLTTPDWTSILTTVEHTTTIQLTNEMAFYRIREQ